MPSPRSLSLMLPPPSDWVESWVSVIPQGGKVLDIACGSGRHARYLAALGFTVEAVDNDLSACADLLAIQGVSLRQFNLESEPWPYAPSSFQGVVVTNYLHRPLFPDLIETLAPGGVLIYETFALGNERYGRPKNPNYLLLSGELLEVVRGKLRVLAYQDVLLERPHLACVQRICAIR
jgi:SAM-dependent methyltransferase